ncbi:hypothetical protein GYB43_00925 [bacterium]|jgi:hypothetical protein|nr:hypothetical protein [bacterium]
MKKDSEHCCGRTKNSCCGADGSHTYRIDYLFWIGIIGASIGYLLHLVVESSGWMGSLSHPT